jgi:hypothetical protein
MRYEYIGWYQLQSVFANNLVQYCIAWVEIKKYLFLYILQIRAIMKNFFTVCWLRIRPISKVSSSIFKAFIYNSDIRYSWPICIQRNPIWHAVRSDYSTDIHFVEAISVHLDGLPLQPKHKSHYPMGNLGH